VRSSRRIASVQSPIIPIVRDLIESNPGTISLGQGVVSYGPPPQALERAAHFPSDPQLNKYAPVPGYPPLLEALTRKLRDENGIRLDSDRRLMVTAGANMAFVNALLAIADPEDEIILLRPFYFNYEMAVAMANCRTVIVDTDRDYQPDLDAIRDAITPRTRAIITISPNNPTGAVYPRDTLTEINSLCRERGLYHIHDEAYEYFTYGGVRHFSPGALPDSEAHTVSLFSLSKSYGFASWRIGYMVIPEQLFEPVRKIQDTILICAPVVSQEAAVGALEAGPAYCRANLAEIAAARQVMMDSLSPLHDILEVPPADGAFYFLIRLKANLDDMAVIERLIRKHRVAVIPGGTFGVTGSCRLRVSYGALTGEMAREGIRRLVEGLRSLA
jgi:aspartate/methionine/tyrosine aminotransferase